MRKADAHAPRRTRAKGRVRYPEGTRIKRPWDVHNPKSRSRFGKVVFVYSMTDSGGRYYPELYEVEWEDNGERESGFLPHGIDAV